MVGSSKQDSFDAKPDEIPYATATLTSALDTFMRNAIELNAQEEIYISNYGKDDVEGLMEHLAKVDRKAAPGYLEAFQSAVTAIKVNEAINSSQKLTFKPEWYELG